MIKQPTMAPLDAESDDEASIGSAVLIFVLGAVAGMATTVIAQMGGLAAIGNLLGATKASWYLTRATGIVGYVLLWLSMALGISITNRLARLWPGGPTAFELHEYSSLLGLGFGLFHALILLADHYTPYTLRQIIVPFASSSYRPVWVGVGQISFYISLIVTFSFYVRRQIGPWAWRAIHFLSYLMFVMVMVHGIFSGTDTTAWWMRDLYWFTGLSTVALTIYRIVVSGTRQKPAVNEAVR